MYAYFDGNDWVSGLSARDIQQLAKIGTIKSDTIVRLPNDQKIEASKIAGIAFPTDDAKSPSHSKPKTKQATCSSTIESDIRAIRVYISILFWLQIIAAFGLLVGAMILAGNR